MSGYIIKGFILFGGLLIFPMLSSAQAVHQKDTLKAAILTDSRQRSSMNVTAVSPGDLPLAASATGESDIVKYIQSLPGVATGVGGGNAFYVRGGGFGNNLQTLDGVPLYAASHLLGLASSYSLDEVSTAEFSLGGFSSDEGNLTASHVRMISKDGDFQNFNAKAYVSNFLLGGHVSAPLLKERLSISASLRLSPVQYEYALLSKLMNRNFNFNLDKAAVYDAYAKLCFKVDEVSKLSLSLFHTLDSYKYELNDKSQDSMQWSEFIANLAYERSLWNNTHLNTSLSFNRFGNSQGMMKTLGATHNDLLIRSTVSETILKADAVSRPKYWVEFQYGVKGRFASFNPGSAQELKSDGLLFKDSSPMTDHVMNSLLMTVHGQIVLGNVLRRGLRLSGRLNYHNACGIKPEFSAYTRFELLKGFGLEASCDFLKQYYHSLEGIPLGWSLDMLIPSTSSFLPETSKQFTAGLYLMLGDFTFNAGVYKKDISNILWYTDASRIFDSVIAGWADHIEVGTGSSKGMEFRLRKEGKIVKGQISYTLSKTDRLFEKMNAGNPFPAKFDRKHILNADLSALLLNDERRELSVGAFFTYQSGHWETVPSGSWIDDRLPGGSIEIDYYTGVNNYRMPEYVRVDISTNLKLKSRRHPQEISIGVYNLLNRHNVSWLSYNAEARKWQSVSLFPIMPSLKYTIQF